MHLEYSIFIQMLTYNVEDDMLMLTCHSGPEIDDSMEMVDVQVNYTCVMKNPTIYT